MVNINLIPVIELPHPAEAWDAAGLRPENTWQEIPEKYECYLQKVNNFSGYSNLKSFPVGSGRYPLKYLTGGDVARAIELHIADTLLEDSCALFGGFVLTENCTPLFIPQCCGTLADISSWKAISRAKSFSEYFCLEGHPCPEAISNSIEVEIRCTDEDEAFEKPSLKSYTVSREALYNAVNEAQQSLHHFAKKVDEWAINHGQANTNVSSILIYDAE